MKRVHLNALNIDAPVVDNCFYYDDGLVNNIYRHQIKVCKIHGVGTDSFSKEEKLLSYWPIYKAYWIIPNLKKRNPLKTGACITVLVNKPNPDGDVSLVEAHSHVFVRKDKCLDEIFFVKGHEETHYLIDTGNLEFLESAIERYCGKNNKMEGLPIEMICDIGGFYSLRRNKPGMAYKLHGRQKDKLFYKWIEENWEENNRTFFLV